MSSVDHDEVLALGFAGGISLSVLAILAWGQLGGGGEPPVEEPPPAPAPIKPEKVAFEFRPAGLNLVLPLASLQAELQAQGLQEPAARHAAEVSYKTDVIVSRIAAARTGAEIGALWVEVGVADDEALIQRVERIRAGLDSMAPGGVAAASAAQIGTLLATHPPREEVIAALDTLGPKAAEIFAQDGAEELIPQVAAGAWMEGYLLLSLAMLEKGNVAPAHKLFFHPEIGSYFVAYTATVGPKVVPPALLEPLRVSLDSLRVACEKDPMGPADVAQVRDALSPILGSL